MRTTLGNLPEPMAERMLQCAARQLEPQHAWSCSEHLAYLDEDGVRYYRDGRQHTLRKALAGGYVALPGLIPAAIGVVLLHDTWYAAGPTDLLSLVIGTVGASVLLAAAAWWLWAFRPVFGAKAALYTRGLYLFPDDLVYWSQKAGKAHLRHVPRAQLQAIRAELGGRRKQACMVIDFTGAGGDRKSLRCLVGMPGKVELKTLRHWMETGRVG